MALAEPSHGPFRDPNLAEELSKTVFVVFSDDWGRHPSSCQHLFKRILPHSDVIWFNTIGLRSPRFSLYDIRRAAQVIASWLLGAELGPPSCEVTPQTIRPVMWPSFSWRWAAALNQKLLCRAVRRAI